MRRAAAVLAIGCGLVASACGSSGNRDSSQTSARPDAPAVVMPRIPVRPAVIAHRGASREALENTTMAVALAYQQGAEGVEIDVWLSADGHAVVFHDEDTRRFGGSAVPVAQQSLAELRALDLGGGQRIPLLSEVIDLVPPGRTLFVEIKSAPGTVPAILRVVADTARREGTAITYQSFQLEVLRAVRAGDPAARTYWLLGAQKEPDAHVLRPYPREAITVAQALGLTGLAIDYRALDEAFLEAQRAAGLEVYLWTLDEPAAIRRAAKIRCDWVETNMPAMALQVLNEAAQRSSLR